VTRKAGLDTDMKRRITVFWAMTLGTLVKSTVFWVVIVGALVKSSLLCCDTGYSYIKYCLLGCDTGYSCITSIPEKHAALIFHQNVIKFLLDYVVANTRRQYSSRFNLVVQLSFGHFF
jgi:hypothetical protein